MLNNSVPPHMYLAYFGCSPSAAGQSISLSASKSVLGPFKRNTWGSSSPPSHSATILAGFYSQKLWRLLFLALEPWAGEPGVELGNLAPQGGHPQPRYPSQFLTTAHGCGASPFHISTLPTSFDVAASYIFNYRASVQLDFRQL